MTAQRYSWFSSHVMLDHQLIQSCDLCLYTPVRIRSD